MFRAIENLLARLRVVRTIAGPAKMIGEQGEDSSRRSVKNDPWKWVHWRGTDQRIREGINVAKPRGFSCKRGFPNRSKVLINDPNQALKQTIGSRAASTQFDRMWDAIPIDNSPTDDSRVFWRNYIQSNSRYRSFDGVATLTDLSAQTATSAKSLSENIADTAPADGGNKVCDELCLETLLKAKEDRLQRLVASPKTTRALLKKLSQAADADIRAAVAFAPSADEDIHKTLAKDDSTKVRCMLAQSSFISITLLKQLIRDESPYVAFMAKKNIERRQQNESNSTEQQFSCEPVLTKYNTLVFEPVA